MTDTDTDINVTQALTSFLRNEGITCHYNDWYKIVDAYYKRPNGSMSTSVGISDGEIRSGEFGWPLADPTALDRLVLFIKGLDYHGDLQPRASAEDGQ